MFREKSRAAGRPCGPWRGRKTLSSSKNRGPGLDPGSMFSTPWTFPCCRAFHRRKPVPSHFRTPT